MIPTNPTADALTRRAFAGVSAYVIAWQGQPVGRVAFREDGGDLRCLLTVAGAVRPSESTVSIPRLSGATRTAERDVLCRAAKRLVAPDTFDYDTDGSHIWRVRRTFNDLCVADWQAALRSAGYDVWLAL